MIRKNCLVVLFFSLFALGVINLPALRAEVATDALSLQVQELYDRAKELVESGQNPEAALSACKEFLGFVRNNGGDQWDDLRFSTYLWKADVEAKMGDYYTAAGTLREAQSLKPRSDLLEKTLAYQSDMTKQGGIIQITTQFNETKAGLLQQINSLMEAKKNKVAEMMKIPDGQFKPENLTYLQGSLKEVNNQIGKLRATLEEAQASTSAALQQMGEVNLMADQKSKIEAAEAANADLEQKIQVAEYEANFNLLTLTEKAKFSFDGLKEKMEALLKTFEKLQAGQEQCKKLSKNFFTAVIAKKIRADLEKAMTENFDSLKDFEKAFMDAKIFNQMSPDQAKMFTELFQKLREKKAAIEATQREISEADLIKNANKIAEDIAKKEKNLVDLKSKIDKLTAKSPTNFFQKIILKTLTVQYQSELVKLETMHQKFGTVVKTLESIKSTEVNKVKETLQSLVNRAKVFSTFKTWLSSFLKKKTNPPAAPPPVADIPTASATIEAGFGSGTMDLNGQPTTSPSSLDDAL